MQFGCTQLKTRTQFDPKLGFGTSLNNTLEYINLLVQIGTTMNAPLKFNIMFLYHANVLPTEICT